MAQALGMGAGPDPAEAAGLRNEGAPTGIPPAGLGEPRNANAPLWLENTDVLTPAGDVAPGVPLHEGPAVFSGGESYPGMKPTNDAEEFVRRAAASQEMRDKLTGTEATPVSKPGILGEALGMKPTNEAPDLAGRSSADKFEAAFRKWIESSLSPAERRIMNEGLEILTEDARAQGREEGIVMGAVDASFNIMNRPEIRDWILGKMVGEDQQGGQETYWRAGSNPEYYEVTARTPEEFQKATDSFIDTLRSGVLGRSPQGATALLNNFKKAFSAEENRQAMAGNISQEVIAQQDADFDTKLAELTGHNKSGDQNPTTQPGSSDK